MARSRSLPMAARGDASLRETLDAILATADAERARDADPVSFVHRFDDAGDREVVGLIAALLAFGNVTAIRRSIARVLDVLGSHPSSTIDALTEGELRERLEGFVHRVYRGDDVARVLAQAAALRRAHGSLGAAFAQCSTTEAVPTYAAPRARFVRSLTAFADALRGPSPWSSGLAHLVPEPRRGSACKRLCLYLRWMCRAPDGVDVGGFPFPPSELVIPVDTHVHRIAQNLGLTRRADASLRTAIEITEALARLDAADPVRYDFALCHFGVSRQCPSRRDDSICVKCVVRTSCRHWRDRPLTSLEAAPRAREPKARSTRRRASGRA